MEAKSATIETLSSSDETDDDEGLREAAVSAEWVLSRKDL